MRVKDKDFQFAKNERVVILSDLHLNHNREFLYGKRGFSSIKEHDEFIFDLWKTYIDHETIVLNLGDTFFNDPDFKISERYFQLPYKYQILINGNHKSGTKGFSYGDLQNNITVRDYAFGVIGSQKYACNYYTLSHFPLYVWNKSHNGTICLSGHSHGSCEATNVNSSSFGKLGKIMDCGVECALQYYKRGKFFFEISDINNIMQDADIVKKDHHDETTN